MVALGDLIATATIFVAAILPGLPLAWGIARRARWDPLAILPLSFAATLAFAGLAGVAGRVLGFDLTLASWLFVAVATLAGVGGVWYGLRTSSDNPDVPSTESDTEPAPLWLRLVRQTVGQVVARPGAGGVQDGHVVAIPPQGLHFLWRGLDQQGPLAVTRQATIDGQPTGFEACLRRPSRR